MMLQPSTPHSSVGQDWAQMIDHERMRRERLQKARRGLESSEADALLFIAPENVRYVTGLRSPDMPQVHFGRAACLLPRQGEPVVYAHYRDPAEQSPPWLNGRFSDVSCWGIDTREGALAWAEDVRRWLGKLDLAPRELGVDFWTPALRRALPEVFPQARFIDGQSIVMRARMIKTADELACMKLAYAVTAAGMAAAREYLRPGVRECELQAVAFSTMFALGSEWQQQSGILSSETYPYRRLATDKIVHAGELVVMDIGGRVNGYMGDLTRTWVCGTEARPTREQVRVHLQGYHAMRRAEGAVKPGATTAEVAQACGEENIMGGILGHGVGLGNEPPSVGNIPGEPIFTLEPGMVFSIEPYVGAPGVGGVRLEDNLIVTANGYELISTFPFEEKLMG